MRIDCILTNIFDKEKDADLYESYNALSLLIFSVPDEELDKLKTTTNKGKKYRFILEEIKDPT